MEVIHAIKCEDGDELQFCKDDDMYTIAYSSTGPLWWVLQTEVIKWSLAPTELGTYREMDKFILAYFPESLVTLVALETA